MASMKGSPATKRAARAPAGAPPSKRAAPGPPASKSARSNPPAKYHDKRSAPVAAPAGPKTSKEKRQEVKDKKLKLKKNYSIVVDSTARWEELRQKSTPSQRRLELVSQLLKGMKGRLPEMALSHTTSRVVQACVKHGSPKDRAAILAELKPKLYDVSRSGYGRFVACKLISTATPEQVPELLRALRGRIPRLARHPAATHVVDALWDRASAAQRAEMTAEFYGREFRVLGLIAEGAGARGEAEEGGEAAASPAPPTLANLLQRSEAGARVRIFRELSARLLPIAEKKLVDSAIVHRLLHEFLTMAPAAMVTEAIAPLSSEALLHMAHTHEGAGAACAVAAYGSAKDRKKVLRVLKGHVPALARDEWGHALLLTLLRVTDDTSLLNKSVVADYQKELDDFVTHKAAARILLDLLRPSCARYVPFALEALVAPPPKRLSAAAPPPEEGSAAALDTSDLPMAPEELSEDESDDEDGVAGAAVQTGGLLGASKKDALLRRREILAGGLGSALERVLAARADELLRLPEAGAVVVEACGGGAGGALALALGEEKVEGLQRAVVSALRGEGSHEETGVAGPVRPALLEDYWASRTLRRVLLLWGGEEKEEAARLQEGFVERVWEEAVRPRCAQLVGGHAAKVVAALAQAAGGEVRDEIRAELQKCLGEKQSVDAWMATFAQHKKETR